MSAGRVLIVSMLLAIFAAWPRVGAAAREQHADRPLDLAAMALAPEDVPAGFFYDYGEVLVPAAAIADLVLGGAPPPGLEQADQTLYVETPAGDVFVELVTFHQLPSAAPNCRSCRATVPLVPR